MMRAILQSIRQGERLFKPVDESAQALEEFQAVAKRLKSAVARGWLHAQFQVSKALHTHGYTLRVVIDGPLTFEGDQFLDAQSVVQGTSATAATPPSDPTAEVLTKERRIIFLKPSVPGIGFDWRALWRKFLR